MTVKVIRWILGRFVLAINWLTKPQSPTRGQAEQEKLDEVTAGLVLYHLPTCPFCVKVRRTIARHGLNIELRDTSGNSQHRQALVNGGGRSMVPCLRIEQGTGVRWMYESSDIVTYLNEQVVDKVGQAA